MKNIHFIIQIALGIILAQGFINGTLTTDNYYSGQKIDFSYCWPLLAYLVGLLVVWVFKLTINTGGKENGRIETTSETG